MRGAGGLRFRRCPPRARIRRLVVVGPRAGVGLRQRQRVRLQPRQRRPRRGVHVFVLLGRAREERGVETRYAAIENIILGTLATCWALSPASEHVLLGTLAAFWALSPASEHGIFSKSLPR